MGEGRMGIIIDESLELQWEDSRVDDDEWYDTGSVDPRFLSTAHVDGSSVGVHDVQVHDQQRVFSVTSNDPGAQALNDDILLLK